MNELWKLSLVLEITGRCIELAKPTQFTIVGYFGGVLGTTFHEIRMACEYYLTGGQRGNPLEWNDIKSMLNPVSFLYWEFKWWEREWRDNLTRGVVGTVMGESYYGNAPHNDAWDMVMNRLMGRNPFRKRY